MAWLRVAPAPLDRRIFPGIFEDFTNPTRDALDYMGAGLAKGTACSPGFTFTDTLRMAINSVYEDLWFPFGDHLPSEGEIVRLRASTVLAVDHVMGWVDRHGIDKLTIGQAHRDRLTRPLATAADLPRNPLPRILAKISRLSAPIRRTAIKHGLFPCRTAQSGRTRTTRKPAISLTKPPHRSTWAINSVVLQLGTAIEGSMPRRPLSIGESRNLSCRIAL